MMNTKILKTTGLNIAVAVVVLGCAGTSVLDNWQQDVEGSLRASKMPIHFDPDTGIFLSSEPGYGLKPVAVEYDHQKYITAKNLPYQNFMLLVGGIEWNKEEDAFTNAEGGKWEPTTWDSEEVHDEEGQFVGYRFKSGAEQEIEDQGIGVSDFLSGMLIGALSGYSAGITGTLDTSMIDAYQTGLETKLEKEGEQRKLLEHGSDVEKVEQVKMCPPLECAVYVDKHLKHIQDRYEFNHDDTKESKALKLYCVSKHQAAAENYCARVQQTLGLLCPKSRTPKEKEFEETSVEALGMYRRFMGEESSDMTPLCEPIPETPMTLPRAALAKPITHRTLDCEAAGFDNPHAAFGCN